MRRNLRQVFTQDSDYGPRFRGISAVTRGKVIVSGGKTPESGRKVNAVIR